MITKRMCSRTLFFSASTLLASAMAVGQYQPGGGGQQQPNVPQPTTPSTGTTGPDSSLANQQAIADQTFVRKALEGNAVEVQLGQLAQQKSQSADVKQFGQKMVNDHGQMADKWFKPIAKQLDVSEPKGPSKKDKKEIEKLQGLSGQDFDREYIATMVKDHKEDLKEFKDEAQSAQNQNVKQAAQQGAGVISQHLQMIEQIAQSHNVAHEGKSKTTPGMQ